MAAVIKLANLLQKHSDKEEVKAYLGSFGDDWKTFVEGELKDSNTLNNKSLGGQQPRSIGEEEDADNHYEVNMEKIMARFTNFNQLITSSNSNTDDDDDDEDKKEEELEREDKEEENAPEQSTSPEKPAAAKAPMKIQEVDFKEQEPLDKEFIDTTYWKVDNISGADIDDLMKELEQ